MIPKGKCKMSRSKKKEKENNSSIKKEISIITSLSWFKKWKIVNGRTLNKIKNDLNIIHMHYNINALVLILFIKSNYSSFFNLISKFIKCVSSHDCYRPIS
jgi:hypothetical protein